MVAEPAVAAFKLVTCVVLATVSGAVPVATVEVMGDEALIEVNAPLFGVPLPMVPGASHVFDSS